MIPQLNDDPGGYIQAPEIPGMLNAPAAVVEASINYDPAFPRPPVVDGVRWYPVSQIWEWFEGDRR